MYLKIEAKKITRFSIMDMNNRELSDLVKCIKFTAENSKNQMAGKFLKNLEGLLIASEPDV